MQTHTQTRSIDITLPRRTILNDILACAVAASLSGCLAGGQLNQATITRACTEGEGCEITSFPRPLAAGARTLTPVELAAAAGTPALHLRAANEGVALPNGPFIEGVGTGTTAILVENDDGVVLDFIHISVVVPTLLTLHADGSEAPLEERFDVGLRESRVIDAKFFGGAQELLGDADETWTVDNPEFVIQEEATSRRIRVTAPSTAGSTTLTYATLGLNASLLINVVAP